MDTYFSKKNKYIYIPVVFVSIFIYLKDYFIIYPCMYFLSAFFRTVVWAHTFLEYVYIHINYF